MSSSLGKQWAARQASKGPVSYCEPGRHLFAGEATTVPLAGRQGPTMNACAGHAKAAMSSPDPKSETKGGGPWM